MVSHSFWKVLRDPLFHFLVLGAGLFFVYSALNGSGDTAAQRIVVDQNQALRLAEQFQRTWMRPPTQQELESLAEEFVKEEILYREALALGLDQDDLVIRRRLRQKMEFINADLVEPQDPSEAELQAYFNANHDRFRQPDRFSFQQVYLNPQNAPGDVKRKAEQLLARLNSKSLPSADPESIGDISLLPYQLDALTAPEVSNTFGNGFAKFIKTAPTGRWSGPYESSFGIHLVRILAREPGYLPAMADIRPVVEREWYTERRKETKDLYYQEMRSRYDVDIRLPDGATAKTLAVR
ncbi:MAG: hypothetical protein AMJ54_05120 [Deltaproteobacteria bacterium SG8_13]|nr:MAG: hypothetical protein AMJ54_05120 [Deltaproteobacteria bacterium SG8_13]